MQDCKCLDGMTCVELGGSYLEGCPSCTLRTSKTRRGPRDNVPLDPDHTIHSGVSSEALALALLAFSQSFGGLASRQGTVVELKIRPQASARCGPLRKIIVLFW